MRSSLLFRLLPAVLLAGGPGRAPAQGPSPTNAAGERAQAESYIRILKLEKERADRRAEALRNQLLALDDDIETRLERIVSLLASVRDSTDAVGSRLRMEKEDTLEALRSAAQYYALERDRRRRELGNSRSAADPDDLTRQVAALNERIEARVTQSLEIASSLMQHREGGYTRYRDSETDYSAKTREYRKAEQEVSAGADTKAELAKTLQTSIEKLKRDQAACESQLKTAKDAETQARLTNQIAVIRETIEARRGQLEKTISGPASPTQPVSSKGAFEMQKMIDDMTAELRRDFAKFKSLVIENDTALARARTLSARLAEAEASLAGGTDPTPKGGANAKP